MNPLPTSLFAFSSRRTAWLCRQCRQSSSAWSDTRRNGLAAPLHLRLGRGTRHISSSEAPSSSVRKELPSHEESRRSQLARRFSHVMDHLQANIFVAGQRLNDLTGYTSIETLKREIEKQEEMVRSTRSALQDAKAAYASAISQRSASQREVNELLQRKHAWSPTDLERFTSLYRSDHANEQAEASAAEAVATAERKAEEASAKLSASILARYHEEQIWSDKIRRMSTWGTWGLVGMNALLFLLFQIAVEPWRRRRLVKGFEDKVLEALKRESANTNATTGAALAALQAAHTASVSSTSTDTAAAAAAAAAAIPQAEQAAEEFTAGEIAPEFGLPPEEVVEEPEVSTPSGSWYGIRHRSWKAEAGEIRAWVEDLFSDRAIAVRKVDVTAAALEGAFAGIALASVFAALIRTR